MKITELASHTSSPEPIIFGVEVDGECFAPPPGLERIGMLWKSDEAGAISDDLVDTIIAFSLSGVEVILEVRPQDQVDHGHLLTIAGNAGFSLSAIPPETEDQVDRDAWRSQCAGFIKALMTTPNFSGDLYPATGFLTYLIAERFAGAERLDPTDAYVIKRFSSAIPSEWSDGAKAEMRSALHELFGGEDKLAEFLTSLVQGLYDESERHVLEMADARPRLE